MERKRASKGVPYWDRTLRYALSATQDAMKEGRVTTYIPAPDPITPALLTSVLYASGALAQGQVLAMTSQPTGAFNSNTSHLRLRYSNDAAPGLTPHMILKRNIPAAWGVEAG